MKRVLFGIVLVAALMLGGCLEDFTPDQLQELAAQNEVLQKQVDEMQADAVEIAAEIQAAEIVDDVAVAKLAKINKEIDRLQAQIKVYAKALEGVPLTGDAAQDFISQLQAANTASAPVNPYMVPIGAGLSVLSMVLAWLAQRNGAEASKQKLKYQAHKQGVERTIKEMPASANEELNQLGAKLYRAIGDARAVLGVK